MRLQLIRFVDAKVGPSAEVSLDSRPHLELSNYLVDTATDSAEAVPVPLMFLAATVKVYAVFVVRPVTTNEAEVAVAVAVLTNEPSLKTFTS